MKKLTRRPLALATETVRRLDDRSLATAGGGSVGRTAACTSIVDRGTDSTGTLNLSSTTQPISWH